MRTLLITVDALRKDHLSYFGYERETTPFLDKLAEENTVFENCYSASSHTRESIPSILTGKRPGKSISGYYNLDNSPIAEILPDEVETKAITTGCYLTKTEGLDRGFDKFSSDYFLGQNLIARQTEYLARIAANQQHRTAEKLKEDIISGLESEESFVWTHLMDVHGPYNKYSESFFGERISSRKLQLLFRKALHAPSIMSEQDRQKIVDAYDNSLKSLDNRLEEIISEIPENTKVIIVGDHGELLGDNGLYEHPRMLEDELIEVPLIIKNREDKNFEKPVSTTAIAPTIAEYYKAKKDFSNEGLYSSKSKKIEASCLKKGKRIFRKIENP